MLGFCRTKYIGLFKFLFLVTCMSPAVDATLLTRARVASLSFQDNLGDGRQAYVNQFIFNKKMTSSVFAGLSFGLGFLNGQSANTTNQSVQSPALLSGILIPIEYSWPVSKVVLINFGYYFNQLSYRPSLQLPEQQVSSGFWTLTGQSYLTRAFFMELSLGINSNYSGGAYQALGFGVLLN